MILGLIFFIVLTEWIGDAFVYVVEPDAPGADVAILAGPLSLALEPIGDARPRSASALFAWAHILLVLGFGAYLPYSKHLHIISSEPNVYFRNLEPRGALRKMDLEAEPEEGEELPVFGAKGLKDLTWRHLLDGLACTECGRCMEFCPAIDDRQDTLVRSTSWRVSATRSRRPRRRWRRPPPRSARGRAAQTGERRPRTRRWDWRNERAEEALSLPLMDNAIPEEAVWQCTTCGWCVEGCPVLIEHVDTIVEIRRNAVLEESRFPKELNAAFRNMENAGNPWGQPKSARLDWAGPGRPGPRPGPMRRARAPRNDGRPWRTIYVAPTGDRSPAGPVLGRLRRRVRRSQPQGGARHGPAAESGRGAVRRARLAGDLHRRSGPAGGKRVPVPDAGRGERGDPLRGARRARRSAPSSRPARTASTRSATSTRSSA